MLTLCSALLLRIWIFLISWKRQESDIFYSYAFGSDPVVLLFMKNAYFLFPIKYCFWNIVVPILLIIYSRSYIIPGSLAMKKCIFCINFFFSCFVFFHCSYKIVYANISPRFQTSKSQSKHHQSIIFLYIIIVPQLPEPMEKYWLPRNILISKKLRFKKYLTIFYRE